MDDTKDTVATGDAVEPKFATDAPTEHADATPAAPVTDASESTASPSKTDEVTTPSTGLQLRDVPAHESSSTVEPSPAHPAPISTSTPYSPSKRHAPDSPTTSLIASLRTQLELVSEQAQMLNTKLVASISKHAELEDQVYTLTHEREQTATHVADLQREKEKWEESMNTGLLVEHSQIRDEMQRLAAKAVEEERLRGTAEEERLKVENEVDELSASLFQQANTMVAAERMARAQADQRLKTTEENLLATEAAMRDMQAHLQSLPSLQAAVAAAAVSVVPLPRRYLSSHPPYAEFLLLLQHLRAARPRNARGRELYPVPSVTHLNAQPFIARCITEDHDPALRLDAAPDLGWVSRRAVSAAIISGDLLIEPVGAASLGPGTISCAMCGRGVFSGESHQGSRFGLKLFSSPSATPAAPATTSVYVFKMATEPKSYPLCRNGWCLERLRAACALWHFVRTGIVSPVWNSEDVVHSRNVSTASATVQVEVPPAVAEEPPLSAHSATSFDATTMHVQPEPKRKGTWNLGFKLGGGGGGGGASAESKGGSWGSWGSRPMTPKDSPVDETAMEGDKVDEAVVKEKEGEKELHISPIVDEKAVDLTDDVTQPDSLDSAKLAPKETDAASVNESEGESFATPVNEARELPEVEKEEKVDEAKTYEPKDAEDTPGVKVDAADAETKPAETKPADAKPADTTPPTGTSPPVGSPTFPTTAVPATEVTSSLNGTAKSTSPQPPARSAARTPAPPLPPRAAGRSRAGNPADATPVASPPATPTVAKAEDKEKTEDVKEETKEDAVDPEEKTEAAEEPKDADATADEPKDADATADEPKEESAGATATASPESLEPAPELTTTASPSAPSPTTPTTAPPLPPRHMSAPTSPTTLLPPPPQRRVISGSTAARRADTEPPHSPRLPEPEKTFATGESWEVRAWRQVVKLKEDMWRARVGVVDDE